MICVQSSATPPIVRAYEQGADDITPQPAGTTIATGLNVAQNLGHINVLRIIRSTGGCALAVGDDSIRAVIRDEWRGRPYGWSPQGAATPAGPPRLAGRRLSREGDRGGLG